MSEQLITSDFSAHLFWDIDANKLDWEKNKAQIIQRVLEYGLLSDWKLIQNKYGISQIGEVCKSIRSLDRKSLVFIATLADIPLNSFRCYTTTPLTNSHWA